MIDYLRQHPDEIAPEMISVKAHRSPFSVLNEEHIDATDFTVPIILAEIRPGIYNVIDGNHRIEKAYRSNVEFVPAYKLSPKQHMPFLTSLKAYHLYIEYWNSKLKDSIFPASKKPREKNGDGCQLLLRKSLEMRWMRS
jgi:hypothetical protein